MVSGKMWDQGVSERICFEEKTRKELGSGGYGLFENRIGKKNLAKKLEVSISFINKMMRDQKIPYKKYGRSVRFKFSDVVAALDRSSQ